MNIDYQLLAIGIALHIVAWLLIHSAVTEMMDDTAEGECWLVQRLHSLIVIYRLRSDVLSAAYVNVSQVRLLNAKEQFCVSLLNYLSTIGFKVL